MNEQTLISDARNGSQAAWGALVRQYEEGVFRLAYLLLGNADDARDVAQETFLRAFRSLEQFDAERPLQPWLLQIAKNLARNRLLSIKRYRSAWARWFGRQAEETKSTVEVASSAVDADLVWQAVRRLRQSDQEIIYLRYFLGCSVAETAEILDIAEGTVKSRHARTLNRLKQVIESDFPELGCSEMVETGVDK